MYIAYNSEFYDFYSERLYFRNMGRFETKKIYHNGKEVSTQDE
jgi:hypothetical protein